MDDSAINCGEITNANARVTMKNKFQWKVTCKTQHFYNLQEFLLITMILLMAVSIYCHLRKYSSKQKCLLSFHVCINDINWK